MEAVRPRRGFCYFCSVICTCMLIGFQTGCLVSVEGQPLTQVQQFLQDYSRGVRVSELSASVEGSLVSSLLTALPVEPHQLAGECNTTYDPTADDSDRFAVLLASSNCLCSQDDLPSVDVLWQVTISITTSCRDSRDAFAHGANQLHKLFNNVVCLPSGVARKADFSKFANWRQLFACVFCQLVP